MRGTERRLIRSSRPARAQIAATIAVGVVQTALVIAQAVLLASVIAGAFVDGRSLSELTPQLLWLAGVAVARGLVAMGFETSGRIGAARVMADLRAKLVSHLLRERPGDLSGERQGEIAATAVQGVDALEAYFARYLPQVALAAIAPLAIVAWSFAIDPAAAAILAITFPLIPVFMILIGKAAERRTKARWQTMSRLSAHFLDVVGGLKTLRANGRAEAQERTIATAGDRYRRETMATLRVGFLSALVLELLAMLGTALVAATVGIQLAGGHLGLEQGLTVLILAPELYLPLRQLGAQFHASADGMAAAERIFEIIDTPAAIDEPAKPVAASDPGTEGVVFRELGFGYPGRGKPTLRDVSFTIGPGETVALVGPSGVGKSTLAGLLLRLADPDRGAILCGGVDLRRVAARDWRRMLAWVPQRPTIFSASVAENVRFAAPAASDTEVAAALERSGALEFVEQLPQGIATQIGDGARALSAGQAQRIALARAFVSPAPLVVLDEPTANLDHDTERSVARAAAELVRDRTALLIAHRPEMAEIADRIVELRDGCAHELDPAPEVERVAWSVG